ncbi:MAG: NCS1 family nucleobase:cation symporter-1 [Sandaracinaceae bacterium]|nr:NCS1 family nucleobase:cation symporter-1 [Sandaracinaceae bacterium]
MHDPKLAEEALAELPPDIATSPLFSGDLAPVPLARRNWTTYNFAALWVSMAHCIPTYMMAGGLIAQGMNWWQALLTIAVGNIIVLVPILLNAHPGTKYGLPFPVLARASFGTAGANIPAVLRAIVACGWFGIQTFIGGEAVRTFVATIWPGFEHLGGDANFLGLSLSSAITFAFFWSANIYIIYRGMDAVRVFENWAAPIVLVMAAWLLWWSVDHANGFGPMLTQASTFADSAAFWKVFVPSVTGVVGFWSTLALNIPDFTRYGRGQKEQLIGQTIGLPTTMILFSAMGVAITSAAKAILVGTPLDKLWDPVYLLSQITSPVAPEGLSAPLISSGSMRLFVAVISLVGVVIATISVNIAANVVSPANDFANLAPQHISFKTGGLITGILGVLMLPWKLMASASVVFAWLIGYSALLGPIAGVMIADYWIVRKTVLDVPDLYRENGQYRGVNWIAVSALAAGIAPNIPGFLVSVSLLDAAPQFFLTLYTYAWFVGVFIAGGVYTLGMRLRTPRR